MKRTCLLRCQGEVLFGLLFFVFLCPSLSLARPAGLSAQSSRGDVTAEPYAGLFREGGQKDAAVKLLERPELSSSPEQIPLQNCWDDKFGLKMLCHQEWGLYEEDGTMLIIISRDPAVTMTIARIDNDVKFLSQLNKDYLDQMGQYQNGFRVDEEFLGGERSLKVKAFSKTYPEIRLLDYYLVHDDGLYGVLFSVNPRSEWEQYKYLIDKLARSIEFLDRGSFQTREVN